MGRGRLLGQRPRADLSQAHLGDRRALRFPSVPAKALTVPRLANKTAVITGAARGIGRATALRFAQEGADVALLDIGRDVPGVPYPGARANQLDEVRAEVEALGRRALALTTDVTDTAQVNAAAAKVLAGWGRIDIMVAAAGIDSWARA